MKSADNTVKMKACKIPTNNSNTLINNAIGNASPLHATLPNAKMIPINAKTMICPAVMFANKRTVKANGFVKTPTISIGIIIGNKAAGTPGGLKMCAQYLFFAENKVRIRVNNAKTSVKLIFPVKLAPPGIIGNSPNKLVIQIKKNIFNK